MKGCLRALLSLGLITTLVIAGPEWREDEDGGDDAGATGATAQGTTGPGGPILGISGRLQGLAGGTLQLPTGPGPIPDDFQDVYIICIDDPDAFAATTCSIDGFSEFDARLYLFSLEGLGIVGNNLPPNVISLDTATAPCPGARLTNLATDATGSQVIASGLYLLAITTAPFTPLGPNGEPIFFFADPQEISGPDGPGGPGPLVDWDEATGACCVAGSCIVTTAADCGDQDGEYFADDTLCADVVCTPVGACFLGSPGVAGRGCIETTEADCLAMSGHYDGDGSACPVFGACIFNDGKYEYCEETTADDCAKSSGDYQGDGTECAPIGACEFRYGVKGCGDCYELTEADCIDAGGDYQGDGTMCGGCDPVTAPARGGNMPLAANGNPPIAAGGDTPEPDGEYRIMLTGVCFANQVPTGRCDLPDGGCVVTTEFDCLAATGTYAGDDTTCPLVYRLGNHPDQSSAPPGCGLRIDELIDATMYHDVFSFDFEVPGAEMYLSCDDDTIHIWGIAYGGRDRGVWYDPLMSGWVEIECTYDIGVQTVPGDDDKIVIARNASNGGTVTFLDLNLEAPLPFFDYAGDFGFTFRFGDEDDDLGHRGFPGKSGWGWLLHPDPDSPYVLSSDWLFTAELVGSD